MDDAAKKARFERLVAEHYAFVWRSVRRLGIRASDLEDMVQEVFLVAARNVDAIESERGYLFQTCVFVCAHARRTLSRRREIVDDDRVHAEVDRAARPDETAEANETRARLQNILDRMPEELRVVFLLYELERFTMAEISESLSIPPGTVASRLRRGREVFLAHATRAQRSGGSL
jgi:RNA polymerase sigma-70 factor (ECF subfamily)